MRENAVNIDKEAVDDSKDQAKAADMKQEDEAASEEQQRLNQEAKDIVKETLRMRLKNKMQAKVEKYDGMYKYYFFKEKFPKAHEKSTHYYSSLKDVWHETFPNTNKKIHEKREIRKERAKIAKEWEEK